MPLLFASHVQQGFFSHLKSSHRGEAVLRDFKQPPLVER